MAPRKQKADLEKEQLGSKPQYIVKDSLIHRGSKSQYIFKNFLIRVFPHGDDTGGKTATNLMMTTSQLNHYGSGFPSTTSAGRDVNGSQFFHHNRGDILAGREVHRLVDRPGTNHHDNRETSTINSTT
ncbi:peptidyl-prolyl cis-trans isomerase B-like [Diadema antillarum]|uniref:peptidyl-prolyl cis-trans isomerase B-like n=1 Tax=Diadema antillarum TaxID=105358 RepID=UPI003A859672